MARAALLLLLCLIGGSCERAARQPVFHENGYPERLSDWALFTVGRDGLTLNAGVEPYSLATPLFSDYALKLRTLALPAGARAEYRAEGAFDFPVGAIVSKTFYYPRDGEALHQGEAPQLSARRLPLDRARLVETRLLVRRAEGWIAIPYVWNAAQDEAFLSRTGAAVPITLTRKDGRPEKFVYLAPDQNQCAGCHATNASTRALQPIGLAARHLNRADPFKDAPADSIGQLERLVATGLLDRAPEDAPANADWADGSASVDSRARAYLDINCSHCHSDVGPADTSGLDLRPTTALGPAYGLCKSPIAAGAGTGGRAFDIAPGEPDRSIFVYRLRSTDPGKMMPELGRALAHEEGVALIEQWIESLEGRCA